MAIQVEGVDKLYRRVGSGFRFRTLKSALLSGRLVNPLDEGNDTISALRDVSFSVESGRAFGLVGGNGSGKSTLLKLVAGLLKPTRGVVRVDGRVAALIELGAGFHPEISGRENIFINGSVLGLSRRQLEERFASIVEFSGLEDHIEEPVKNYSSGMYVRLGFAVAIHTRPQILLVDEVLSVGDEAFAHKCLRAIEEHLARGGTLLVVSHSLSLVEELCSEVAWLDRGRLLMSGEPRRVIDAYREAVAVAEGLGNQDALERMQQAEIDSSRWGSRRAEISRARLLVNGVEQYHCNSGDEVTVELEVEATEKLADFVFGLAISTPRGVECWGTNTDLAGWRSECLQGQATVRVVCPSLRLGPGDYHIDLAVHAKDGAPYDYRRKVLTFTVSSKERGVGLYLPEHRWQFAGGALLEKGINRKIEGAGTE